MEILCVKKYPVTQIHMVIMNLACSYMHLCMKDVKNFKLTKKGSYWLL